MQFGLETPVNWPPVATKMGVLQQRRKWSDWSECSIECKKTRHRLDCEDLLVAQQNNKNSNSNLPINSNKTQTGSQNGHEEPTKRQVNKLSAGNEDQLEDEEDGEDYGDVGDDEGVTDSCDKVEPSKTYQEIACRGGSCRLASINKRPTSFATVHERPGLPKAVATSTAAIKPSLASIQDASIGSPTVDSLEQQDKGKEVRESSNYTNMARGESSVSSIWPTRPMQPTTTKNMWLPQFSGGLNQDNLAYVVQWAILIGALLTVILLIVLMLRKLFVATFPSYHWMLAKQTIKSGANAYTVADCCHPTASSLSCPSATGSVVLEPPHCHHHHHHQHQHPVGHLVPRQYCVDSKGRAHLLASLGQQQLDDQIYVEPTEVVAAERSSAATTSSSGYRQLLNTQLSRPGDHSEGNQSLRSTANYAVGKYDTLNSCDKGFVMTRDFISYPAQDQDHHQHRHPSLMQQQQTRSIKTSVGPDGHRLPSHRSPSSSLSNDEDVENKLNVDADDDDDQDERSSGQSTTAQMLSNAASSSFEQPPELEAQSIVTVQPVGLGVTPRAMPASFTHRPRHQQSAKLTSQSNLTKSQPNSPMFVNQFHQKNHQNRRHPPKLSTHKRSLSQDADGTHEYARPEEQVAPKSSGGGGGGGGGGASGSSQRSNDQNVLRLARDLEAGHCDNSQERHYYESLDEHRLNEDQE